MKFLVFVVKQPCAKLLILVYVQKEEALSTHEKQLKKIHSKIEQMEKANLEPKTWTMQGEVKKHPISI